MTTRFKGLIAAASLAVIAFAAAGINGVRASSTDNGAYKQLGVYSEVLQRIRDGRVANRPGPGVPERAARGR